MSTERLADVWVASFRAILNRWVLGFVALEHSPAVALLGRVEPGEQTRVFVSLCPHPHLAEQRLPSSITSRWYGMSLMFSLKIRVNKRNTGFQNSSHKSKLQAKIYL